MTPTAKTQEQSQRRLEHEIRGMISALTRHLTSLGKPSATEPDRRPAEEAAEDGAARVVTLAGENKGAIMKAAGWDEAFDTNGMLYGDDERLSAIANSNYQSANNSILIGGSCKAEDPGLHIVISDHVEDEVVDGEEKHKKKDKKKNKKKKKKKKIGSSNEEEHEDEEEEEVEMESA